MSLGTGAEQLPSERARVRWALPLQTGWIGTWKFARKKPLGFIGGVLILIMVVLALLPAQIAPYSPIKGEGARYEAPSAKHWMGTDQLGRDVLSRTIWGARISIGVGVTSVLIGVTAGLFLALVAGYMGGILDMVSLRFVDAMLAFPGLVLALFFVTLLQPGAVTVAIAVAITMIAPSARILRSSVLGLKEMPYIDSARAVGASTPRILLRHIFPNLASLYVILISLSIGSAIIIETSLTFIGLGVSAETPTWGNMVHQGTRNLFLEGWWLPILPSAAIAAAVYGFNMLGDALRDILDPRLRGATPLR